MHATAMRGIVDVGTVGLFVGIVLLEGFISLVATRPTGCVCVCVGGCGCVCVCVCD